MKPLLDRVRAGETLIGDGAMGTFLQAKGLQPGECPEAWSVSHPDVVRDIAAAYRDAGADIVETNSFGGTAFKLKEYRLGERVAEFNTAAARLAREAMGTRGYVAASVGPTGQIAEEEGGNVGEEDLYHAFRAQTAALAAGGADAFCIETFMSVVEARQAIRAAKETGLPVFCTFTFEWGQRGFRTLMGADPARAAREAHEAGADVVGANCGNGIAQMIEITKQIRAALPEVPILIQSNAGVPVLEGGRTVFKETPAEMAARVPELIAAGANIIGGCCGTTPAHIAALEAAARAR